MDLDEIYETYTKYDPESLNLPQIRNSNKKIFYLVNPKCIKKESDLKLKFSEMETDCFKSSLKSLKLLNKCLNDDNERNIFEAWFEFKSEKEIQILPGDSFGFLIGNFDEEVNEMIKLLNLSEYENFIVDYVNPKQRNIPKDSIPRILKYYVNIRAPLNQSMLYEFSFYCNEEKLKNCLKFLSSKEGSKLFEKYIIKQNLSLLDLMKYFETHKFSCKSYIIDSVEFKPRYYTIIEHKVEKKETYEYQIKIAFNVVHLPKILNRKNTHLLGVFTGTMQQRYFLKNKIQLKKDDSENNFNNDQVNEASLDNLSNEINSLDLNQVYYLFKSNQSVFKMADKLYSNTILISVGTGITPFLSFFKYLEKNKIQNLNIWLIHGCKDKRDCLYLDELIKYEKSKLINNLQLCYSNTIEHSNFNFVQDYIKQETKLKVLIDNNDTIIYVSGDEKNFKKDVWNAFFHIDNKDNKKLKEMQIQKRYLQNVW